MDAGDDRDRFEVPMLMAIRGKKLFNLVYRHNAKKSKKL